MPPYAPFVSRSVPKGRVLVVDNDKDHLGLLKLELERAGFEVETLSGPIGVSYRIRVTRPAFVLIDLSLPAIRGDKLLRIARLAADTETRFYYYSAADEDTLRALSARDGVSYIRKSGSTVAVAQQLSIASTEAVRESPRLG